MTSEPFVSVVGHVPLSWAPDRGALATVTAGGLAILEGGEARVLGAHHGVHELAWSPDARALAIGAEEGGFPGVRVISADDGAPIWTYVNALEAFDELRWSPDGRRIAALSSDLSVLDARSGELQLRLRPGGGEAISEVVWSPSSRWLLLRGRSYRRDQPGAFRVCAAADGATVVSGPIADDDYLGWSAAHNEVFGDGADRLATRSTGISPRFRRSLVYTPDGVHAAAEGEQHVLWIEGPGGVLGIDGHPRTITALVLTPRGEVATGCRDGAVRRVHAGGEALQQCWRGAPGERVEQLAWASDGASLAVRASDRVVLLSRRILP